MDATFAESVAIPVRRWVKLDIWIHEVDTIAKPAGCRGGIVGLLTFSIRLHDLRNLIVQMVCQLVELLPKLQCKLWFDRPEIRILK